MQWYFEMEPLGGSHECETTHGLGVLEKLSQCLPAFFITRTQQKGWTSLRCRRALSESSHAYTVISIFWALQREKTNVCLIFNVRLIFLNLCYHVVFFWQPEQTQAHIDMRTWLNYFFIIHFEPDKYET